MELHQGLMLIESASRKIHNEITPIFQRDGRDNLEHQFPEVEKVLRQHLSSLSLADDTIKYLTWEIASDFVGSAMQPISIQSKIVRGIIHEANYADAGEIKQREAHGLP